MRSTRNQIAAFFDSPGKAQDALQALHDAGFRAEHIGCSFGNYDVDDPDQRSMWEKIKDFFGDEDYSDRPAGQSYAIPERFQSRLKDGGCLITVSAEDRLPQAEQILKRYDATIERDFAFQEASGDIEGQRIQLLSEVLRVNKERVQTGEVRLRKEVTTERQNVEVPVTREELVVERRPVNDQRPVSGEVGAGKEIRVPLSEERVHVEKRPVVSEEVQVGKKKIQDTRVVGEDVKREELKVEKEGNIREDDLRKRKTG